MENSQITPGSGTHCIIDGTPFDDDGFCAQGHQKEQQQRILIPTDDSTHCRLDGAPFDDDGICTYGHLREAPR